MPRKRKHLYDVFLSHRSAEKDFVEALAVRLGAAGLRPFLDKWHLIPGERWQDGLEMALAGSRCFAACVGAEGFGRWALEELQVAQDRAASDAGFAIIPVFLPGADPPDQAEIPAFLRNRTWVDLRMGLEAGDGLEALVQVLRRSGGSTRRSALQPSQSAARRRAFAPIKTLEDRFFGSLRNTLAGGSLIRRSETRRVLSVLEDERIQVVVVHGVAGSGKSGVVYELARELAARGTQFLALRLDRCDPRGTPQKFGLSLELPDSPAKSLAAITGRGGGVLLLDQLDALRWTGAHSSEAWDVCRELISEALVSTARLKVVVCCRTFDLEHDPQLRGWEQETKNLHRVEVQPLTTEEVTAAIQKAADGSRGMPFLRPKEQELLRHIHHLQMWLAIYQSSANPPTFDTSWSLMEQFWANRLDELAKEGITRERAEELELRFVKAMEKGAVLTAPVRRLNMTRRELELYQHHHLIQVVASRGTFTFTFSHQSYQDYLVAKHLLSELDQCVFEEGGRRVVAWLGSRERQSLFRREQLRLLLVALRAEEHGAYLPALREFLPPTQPNRRSRIRFHLRLLALQFLSQVTDPRPEEVQLVLTLLEQAFWREHVLAEVVRGQEHWFEVLDKQGKLEAWLASEDDRLRKSALDMLLFVVPKCGDQVARLLRPYLEKDEEWTGRIIWVLRFDPAEDSEALFNLRLQLAKEGAYTADHVDWGKLAQSHPERFIVLISYVLMAFAARISQGESRKRLGRQTEISWYGLEKVSTTVMSRQHWASAWEMLFRSVTLVAQVRAYPEELEHVFESYAVDFDTLRPILRLLKDLGRALLEENWVEFVTRAEEFARVDRRAEVLFLDSLVEGPALPEFADWALCWLLADPWRVRLRLRRGSRNWRLAGRLLERFAPVCSQVAYLRLENWLLNYVEPDLLQNYRRLLERRGRCGDLREPNSFGQAPHALLPKLPADRRSEEVESRLAELNRKFPPRTLSDDEEGNRFRAGWVRSPLSEEARARMTDEDWLAIATNEKLPPRFGKSKFTSDDHFAEASIETFSSEFRSMTKQQPERFARLALQLPPAANPAFLNAILSGLAWPGDRSGQPEIEGWAPPSLEILEKVLELPAVQGLVRSADKEAARYVCEIFGRYYKYLWSEYAIELLVWIARFHSDPESDYYPIGSRDEDSSSYDDLENNALNVTRGAAGFAIRSLLFEHRELFTRLRLSVESLIRDEHPAVRVAALATCQPILNIDRDLAVSFFLQSCEGPDALLATREAWDLLRYTNQTHLVLLRPLIERMVASPLPRVAMAGGAQVAVSFFKERQFEKEFELCVSGTPPQRRGVAEVAGSLLGEGQFAEKAKATLLRLSEDDDKQVAGVVAKSFGRLDLRHISADPSAWSRFARSKAFQTDPSPLIFALGRQAGDLLPFAECLLAVGTTFGEELAEDSQNMATGASGDARQLLPLLLRLYEQAKGHDRELYLRCLDLWDRLLERRVGAAMGLTKELDRV